jgi:hypothetical protein
MGIPRSIRRIGISLAIVTVSAAVGAETRFTKASSDAMQRKVLNIVQVGSLPTVRKVSQETQTPISESEVNSYLRYEIRDQVPTGITEPIISILGDGRLTGTAVVDLDQVRESRQSSSWFDPVRLLTGRATVTMRGTLQTQQGTGRFVFESADISGLPVPKTLLQQVISFYSRTPENPSGLSLDDAFELPARIQEIRVQPGQAIVVQ